MRKSILAIALLANGLFPLHVGLHSGCLPAAAAAASGCMQSACWLTSSRRTTAFTLPTRVCVPSAQERASDHTCEPTLTLATPFAGVHAFAPALPAPMSLRSAASVHGVRSRGAAAVSMAAHGKQQGGLISPAAAVAKGLLAASLLLTPALDAGHTHTDALSVGGAANAQGFVSTKSTRGAPSVDANKDPESILRLSMPINEKTPIRAVQVTTGFFSAWIGCGGGRLDSDTSV